MGICINEYLIHTMNKVGVEKLALYKLAFNVWSGKNTLPLTPVE